MRVEAGRVNTRSVFMVVKGKRVHFDRAVPPMAFRDGRLHGPQLRIRIPAGGIQGCAERHRNWAAYVCPPLWVERLARLPQEAVIS